ncbi:MAG TPA: carbohydrate ABC transporter permease, partial [Sphaerochaeta sp.]|nr:carbohydrate ABC transporter permease [Sphaerochaeta sp.]
MVKKKNPLKSFGFFLLILSIVAFSIFPFVQMLSLSLKYQWDWGNPSLIPRKINLEAYKELLNIGQDLKNVPESVLTLLDETPELTSLQRAAILSK